MTQFPAIAVIIPAYNPDQKMVDLVVNIVSSGYKNVVVVNDGSNSDCLSFFHQIEDKCTVLHHAINLGKGRALKTAFNHLLYTCSHLIGVVTIDSDGQHSMYDMNKVSERLSEKKDCLILGSRNFSEQNIPFRSRFGNTLTRKVFNFVSGMKISDTQTGLRGIPFHFLQALMNVNGERFEFEMNMLLECKEHNVSIEEVKIETIYLNENESSHFNPLVDSIKIYMTFIKYLFSSISSFVVDIVFFMLFLHLFIHTIPGYFTIVATILARFISSFFNYKINKHGVFKLHSKHTLKKYAGLTVIQMFVSAFGFHFLYLSFGNHTLLIKIFVDCFLFLISFYIQRKWIFTKNE